MGKSSVMNLHTHSTFSDGLFSPEAIVEKAASDGLTHIAITDHFETSKVASLRSEHLSKYLQRIEDLGRKYDGTVRVLAGVEIDTNRERCALDSLPFDLLNKLDLVLFEYVNDEANNGDGMDGLDPVLSRISTRKGLAHSDLKTVFADIDPSEVADMLSSRDIFVELNTALPYRRDGAAFYEIAEVMIREFRGMVKLSIGTDIHRRLSEVSNVESAYRFVRRLGLEDDLLF